MRHGVEQQADRESRPAVEEQDEEAHGEYEAGGGGRVHESTGGKAMALPV